MTVFDQLMMRLTGRIPDERYLDLALDYLEQEWGPGMIYQFQQAYSLYREMDNIRTSVNRAMAALEIRALFYAYLDKTVGKWK